MKQNISTKGESALFRVQRNDAPSRCPCTHEESGTWLLLHALDTSTDGYKIVMLWTVDTDVVVLSTAFVSETDIDSFWSWQELMVYFSKGLSSRGARDSKIGKKWPESSRILDYILT